ncbi:zinc finger protein ZPR1 [Lampetra planeri]
MSTNQDAEARGLRSGGPVFSDLDAGDPDQETTEMESLCMRCYDNGVTRLLFTRIPFFREVVLSSFSCEHCGFANSEILSAGRVQEKGVRYELSVRSPKDLDREVVKAGSATTLIPELDFEIPAFTQKGALSTIEGLIDRAVAGLEQDQPKRMTQDPQAAEKIDAFVAKLKKLKELQSPFTLVIDDPSGNSFVENPSAPQRDEGLHTSHYERSRAQDVALGLKADDDEGDEDQKVDVTTAQEVITKPEEDRGGDEDLRNEVLKFSTNCPECNAPASTNMKLIQIPHFKEVIIMATNCDVCGHRTNEVKSGGAIEPLGTRITLRVTDPSDMTRDLLKSETCAVRIPELEFELGMGALGGKFTTLEGLLSDIRDLIVAKNPFLSGDSSTPDRNKKIQEFGRKLEEIQAGRMVVHVVLDDSAGNSYLQNVYAPEPDPEMTVERYERSYDQNDDLGINDMRVENYGEEEEEGGDGGTEGSGSGTTNRAERSDSERKAVPGDPTLATLS